MNEKIKTHHLDRNAPRGATLKTARQRLSNNLSAVRSDQAPLCDDNPNRRSLAG